MVVKKDTLTMGLQFTQVYKQYQDAHPGIREINCLKVMFPHVLGDIRPGDLFAGRDDGYGPIGFVPEGNGHGHNLDGYLYYCDEVFLEEEIARLKPEALMLEQLEEAKLFWRTENTKTKTRKAYSEAMAITLPSDQFSTEPGIVFPLYRIGGIYLDYQKLVTLGIPGMQEEILTSKMKAFETGADVELFQAMEMSLELFIDTCTFYEDQAIALHLDDLAHTLKKITVSRPENLREAIQLTWMYNILSGALNYGRMDMYLGDFYARDLASGLLSEETAVEMVSAFWQLIADRKTIWNGRVIIGGKGRSNEANADLFALAAIEATRRVKEIEPQLSLRFYEGMDPLLMEKALVAIGEGRTYPMLYNDDINVQAVMDAFEVDVQEALQYVPFGCGEYVLNHRSFGTPSGVINLAKTLEVVLNNGFDPTIQKPMGLMTGNDFSDFDALFNAYKKQVVHHVEALADQEALEYKIVGETAPMLYLSLLYDDCIARGKGIFSGGISYLGGTLETYGNTNTADSLVAIKQVVYEQKKFSLETLMKALNANFVGYEKERALLLNAPKFGNDDPIADDLAVLHHEFICNTIKAQKERTQLHSYLAVIINNSTNTTFGQLTGASPDGRKASEPLANANMPSAGSDKVGLTAVMNSQVKLLPNIHAGSVQNIKFSKELFSGSLSTIKALLKTYFERGGTQAMMTVVNRGDLENALKEPEKYRHVFVRVGGFSARFVELDRSVQLEIISRSIH
ncbi:MAG: hypothetical protein H7X94_04420 [Vallitaleaceae bacterium]|nr:hypothetical protein [Vallitaleaceae bacterium]